jgi:hypothetical protein
VYFKPHTPFLHLTDPACSTCFKTRHTCQPKWRRRGDPAGTYGHRRPPPPPLGRSPGGGAGSCPMPSTPGYLPTSSPNAQVPSHALLHGNTPSRVLPPAPTMRSPAPLRCLGCSASNPTLQALCAHPNSPGTTCTFAPDNCLVADAARHLLAPCTFCGRYFWSGGLRRHQHPCFHHNTTPTQPPACGVSLPRGRPSAVHPVLAPRRPTVP